MIRTLTLAAVLLAPLPLAAQDLPTAPYLPLEMAVTAAQAALTACVAEKHAVSVAIVARDGATKVVLKADGSGPHTGSSATGKAFGSAALGRDTAGLAEFIATNPQNDGLRDMDDRLGPSGAAVADREAERAGGSGSGFPDAIGGQVGEAGQAVGGEPGRVGAGQQ
ncbi:MAG TPA: heme-binding protein [Tabrizicola sp.]|nr:heme-binding protein [Tabrizicola sp.]